MVWPPQNVPVFKWKKPCCVCPQVLPPCRGKSGSGSLTACDPGDLQGPDFSEAFDIDVIAGGGGEVITYHVSLTMTYHVGGGYTYGLSVSVVSVPIGWTVVVNSSWLVSSAVFFISDGMGGGAPGLWANGVTALTGNCIVAQSFDVFVYANVTVTRPGLDPSTGDSLISGWTGPSAGIAVDVMMTGGYSDYFQVGSSYAYPSYLDGDYPYDEEPDCTMGCIVPNQDGSYSWILIEYLIGMTGLIPGHTYVLQVQFERRDAGSSDWFFAYAVTVVFVADSDTESIYVFPWTDSSGVPNETMDPVLDAGCYRYKQHTVSESEG